MSDIDSYVKRCALLHLHDQHEWLEYIRDPEGEPVPQIGPKALGWVKPHLCIGSERTLAVEIVDDSEQPRYEPLGAGLVSSARPLGAHIRKARWSARSAPGAGWGADPWRAAVRRVWWGQVGRTAVWATAGAIAGAGAILLLWWGVVALVGVAWGWAE